MQNQTWDTQIVILSEENTLWGTGKLILDIYVEDFFSQSLRSFNECCYHYCQLISKLKLFSTLLCFTIKVIITLIIIEFEENTLWGTGKLILDIYVEDCFSHLRSFNKCCYHYCQLISKLKLFSTLLCFTIKVIITLIIIEFPSHHLSWPPKARQLKPYIRPCRCTATTTAEMWMLRESESQRQPLRLCQMT